MPSAGMERATSAPPATTMATTGWRMTRSVSQPHMRDSRAWL